MRRIVVGITGASGAILGIRFLQELRKQPDCNISLVMSDAAKKNILLETDFCIDAVYAMADQAYENHDLAAPIASGSYQVDAMVVLPCSMKSLSAIAHGFDENLLVRAASVTMKEGRQLILCPRETPLHAVYLENMLSLARQQVAIIPPMLSFYARPETVEDLISQHLMKVFDYMRLPYTCARRWGEDLHTGAPGRGGNSHPLSQAPLTGR